MSVTAVPLRPIKKGSVLRLWLGVAVVAAGSALLTWNGLRPFGHGDSHEKGGQSARISYQILDPGSAEHPAKDDFALVSYKGTLLDGTVFEQTQQPSPVDLSSMLPGFVDGVTKVGRGGHIIFRIPSQLAYGDQARGDKIPANSTLIFDLTVSDFKSHAEVLEMQRSAQMQQMLQQQMQRGGGAPPGAPQGAPPETPGDAPVLQP
jgi:FKBP-type peptidyl-prolyl cis-trans isomerase FkpA